MSQNTGLTKLVNGLSFTYRVEFNLDKTEFYGSLVFNYIGP